MLHKTKGLVIRSVKYGETSLVVTVFTELFGIQGYMVSGVRKTSRKGGTQAGLYQPGTLVDMVVYHSTQQNLHRIRECSWLFMYRNIHSDILKNAVVLFMVELLQKCLRQPEPHPELFHFVEDALRYLDDANPQVTANFPLFFSVHLSHFFGFRMDDANSDDQSILDLREGAFGNQVPAHPQWAGPEISRQLSFFLKAIHPDEISGIQLNREQRRKILDTILIYYKLHSAEFGDLKTIPVLHTIMS